MVLQVYRSFTKYSLYVVCTFFLCRLYIVTRVSIRSFHPTSSDGIRTSQGGIRGNTGDVVPWTDSRLLFPKKLKTKTFIPFNLSYLPEDRVYYFSVYIKLLLRKFIHFILKILHLSRPRSLFLSPYHIIRLIILY